MADVGVDVGKLRQVLDYWSCETCLDTYSPEQDYLCGICVRLNREVIVKRAAIASDEAVQVIPPEDFTMAKDLRDRIQQQELELEEARAQATRLMGREAELEKQLKRLQDDLSKARREKDEAGLVPFEFVGVKDATEDVPEEEILEFEEETPPPPPPTEQELEQPPIAEPKWETVEPSETDVQEEPAFEVVSDSEEPAAPEFESQPQAETIAPQPRGRGQAADDAIARIEAEIGKIEKELTELAQKEKEIKQKAKPSRRKRSS